MAEGSYGTSSFYQTTMSPIEPNTQISQFTPNVNRKKTRKWVEAKKITYDGSGWGDEDDEDDDSGANEDSEASAVSTAPPPVPSVFPSQPLSLGTRNLPSMASAPTSASASPVLAKPPMSAIATELPSLHSRQSPSSSQPSLRLQTQPHPPPRHGSPAQNGPGGSPLVASASSQLRSSSPNSSSGTVSPRVTSLPSSANSRPWTQGRASSPLGPRSQSPAGTTRTGQFIRPSEIYKRAAATTEEGQTRTNKAVETNERAREAKAAAPSSVSTDTTRMGYAERAASSSLASQPASGSSAPAPAPARNAPPEQHKPQPSVESVSSSANNESDQEPGDLEARRFSSSPKLPNLARFSTFSPELLFGDAGFLPSDAPPVPSLPQSNGTPSLPIQEAAKPSDQTSAGVTLNSDNEQLSKDPTSKHQTNSFSSTSGSVAVMRDSTATATTTATAETAATASSASSSGDAPSQQSPATAGSHGVGVVGPSGPAPVEASKVLEPGWTESQSAQPLDVPVLPAMVSATGTVAPTAPLNIQRSAPIQPNLSMPAARSKADVVPNESTLTASPERESFDLQEEILRTLSSGKMTELDASDAKEQPTQQPIDSSRSSSKAARSSEPQAPGGQKRTLTRESSYLQNVYDDYWTADEIALMPEPRVNPGTLKSSSASPSPAPLTTITTPVVAATAADPTAPGAAAAFPAAVLPALSTADSKRLNPEPVQTKPQLPAAPATYVSDAEVPSGTGTLRRRFSWEIGPEETAVVPGPLVPAAPVMATSQSTAPGTLAASQEPKSVSSVTGIVPTTSTPPPLSGSSSTIVAKPAESSVDAGAQPVTARPSTQAPVRSMLDVGLPDEQKQPPSQADEVLRETPVVQKSQAPQAHAVAETTFMEAVPSASPASPVFLASATSPTSPMRPMVQDYVMPTYTGSDGAPTILTLRQCMAFSSHEERMAKLKETRRQHSDADSGLSGWLVAMTTSTSEYSKAPYAPLWEGPSVPVSQPRPVAPHVSMPSGAQISHKGKEILAATGKAGKGLLGLRKKGFHKKAA